MKKIVIFIISFLSLLTVTLMVPSNPSSVNADIGPKPDMEITITNLEKSDYLVAFGVKDIFYGPHRAFNPANEPLENEPVEQLSFIFNIVTLPDGWFLDDIVCSYFDTTDITIKGGYYWPSDFILIILNKVNEKYYLSEETKTYAFHSYFSFDMKDYDDNLIRLNKPITLEPNYNYGKEIGEFFLRLILTLGIELLLALAFKFTKKSFAIIAITNTATQIGLNVALNLTAYFSGRNPWFLLIYGAIEVAIIVVEAIVFTIFCKRKEKGSKLLIPLYAVLANVLSFGLGMLLWFMM